MFRLLEFKRKRAAGELISVFLYGMRMFFYMVTGCYIIIYSLPIMIFLQT